ncbi:MAG: phosphoribosylanthranilate isomerase [Candidatus Helarchaeota archaeon]
MVKVKICGIKDEKILNLAIDKGYHAIGLVVNVERSPRNVSLRKANELFKKIPPFVTSVAVIVPNSINDVKVIEDEIKPDVIQIHGFFEEAFYEGLKSEISTKIINALLLNGNGESQNIDKNPLKAAKILEKYSSAILIDKYTLNKLGGTGTTVNWELARKIREAIKVPTILGGGLTENNVFQAIRTVKPYAIDISSGLELIPGIKDPEKIINFIKILKRANL